MDLVFGFIVPPIDFQWPNLAPKFLWVLLLKSECIVTLFCFILESPAGIDDLLWFLYLAGQSSGNGKFISSSAILASSPFRCQHSNIPHVLKSIAYLLAMQLLQFVHLNSTRDNTVTSLVFWIGLCIYKYWSVRATPGEFLNVVPTS